MSGDSGLAETLRAYLAEHAPLPVAAGSFNLDTLLPAGKSMSLRMMPGEPVHTFIDGTRVMDQPFILQYRDEKQDDNDIRSGMMRSLNAIGGWMRENREPFPGEGARVFALEQVRTASIAALDETTVTYQAGYRLGYETL